MFLISSCVRWTAWVLCASATLTSPTLPIPSLAAASTDQDPTAIVARLKNDIRQNNIDSQVKTLELLASTSQPLSETAIFEVVPQITRLLSNPDPSSSDCEHVHQYSEKILHKIRDSGFEQLVKELGHTSPLVRFMVSQVLGRVKLEEIPILTALLPSVSPPIKIWICQQIMVQAHDAATVVKGYSDFHKMAPDVAAALRPLLHDSDFYVHRWAFSAIRTLGDEPSVKVLPDILDNLASADPLFRFTAATQLKYLGWIVRDQATSALTVALRDDYLGVRLAAAEALQNMPVPAAQHLLRQKPEILQEWKTTRERAWWQGTYKLVRRLHENSLVDGVIEISGGILPWTIDRALRSSQKDELRAWLLLRDGERVLVADGVFSSRTCCPLLLQIKKETVYPYAVMRHYALRQDDVILSLDPLPTQLSWSHRDAERGERDFARAEAYHAIVTELYLLTDTKPFESAVSDHLSADIIDAQQNGQFMVAAFPASIKGASSTHTMVFWRSHKDVPWRQIAGTTQSSDYSHSRMIISILALQNLSFTARDRDGLLMWFPIVIPANVRFIRDP